MVDKLEPLRLGTRCKAAGIEPMDSLDRLYSTAAAILSDPTGRCLDRSSQLMRDLIMEEHDPLGDAYSRLRSSEERRSFGITLTPVKIVRAMVAWAVDRARKDPKPVRVVDPGAGTGRFAIAAAKAFPKARIIAVERDSEIALLLRANLKVHGLADRVEVRTADFREIQLPKAIGPTLFVGNPPYVRHHQIEPRWKRWYAATLGRRGIRASQLAGLHLHFFAKVAELGHEGDYGCFITSAEWLDVGYGAALRKLLEDGLGGSDLHVLEATAEAFPGTMTTAAITGFAIGRRPKTLNMRSVAEPSGLGTIEGGRAVPWPQVAASPRWSVLIRDTPRAPPGWIELGDLCRVHRGQVTGANHIWVAGDHAKGLPGRVLKATITAAQELIAAGAVLAESSHLARVIDLPRDLDELEEDERRAVERFIRWAQSAGAADGYVARHRKPWWAVRLADPAPIVCTYMGRRPPAFVRNRAGARLINIAHGIYPRDRLSEDQLMFLVRALRTTVDRGAGRTYAGGLTKFEPRELERALIPRLEVLDVESATLVPR